MLSKQVIFVSTNSTILIRVEYYPGKTGITQQSGQNMGFTGFNWFKPRQNLANWGKTWQNWVKLG